MYNICVRTSRIVDVGVRWFRRSAFTLSFFMPRGINFPWKARDREFTSPAPLSLPLLFHPLVWFLRHARSFSRTSGSTFLRLSKCLRNRSCKTCGGQGQGLCFVRHGRRVWKNWQIYYARSFCNASEPTQSGSFFSTMFTHIGSFIVFSIVLFDDK